MDWHVFQHKAKETAVYPRPITTGRSARIYTPEDILAAAEIIPVMYCALGLAGEAGEVAEQVKKSWRNGMMISDERREKIKDELGDCLWYLSMVATELDMGLEAIAVQNIEKLERRLRSGQLKERSN